jgi:DUF4097 and DUF4098 domain-containing protein YvlB
MSSAEPHEVSSRIRIALIAGEVIVRGEERDDVRVVEGDGTPEWSPDGFLTIKPHARHARVHLLVPRGAEVVVGTITGTVTFEGEVAIARINTKSGGIRVERALDVDARTLSGAITIGACERCRVRSGSGRIQIGSAMVVEVSSISGRIEVEEVSAEARARSVSGRVDLAAGPRTMVLAETVSGRLTVTVPDGAHPEYHIRSAVGRVRTEVEQGEDGRIKARSLSGSIQVLRR